MCCFGGIEEFVVVAFYDVSHIFQAPIANFYVISLKGFLYSVASRKMFVNKLKECSLIDKQALSSWPHSIHKTLNRNNIKAS